MIIHCICISIDRLYIDQNSWLHWGHRVRSQWEAVQLHDQTLGNRRSGLPAGMGLNKNTLVEFPFQTIITYMYQYIDIDIYLKYSTLVLFIIEKYHIFNGYHFTCIMHELPNLNTLLTYLIYMYLFLKLSCRCF